jgi:hypothetical protein
MARQLTGRGRRLGLRGMRIDLADVFSDGTTNERAAMSGNPAADIPRRCSSGFSARGFRLQPEVIPASVYSACAAPADGRIRGG